MYKTAVGQKALKVCHLTSVHPYDDTRIYVKECCTLANAGYETHLIAPGAPAEVKENVYLHPVAKCKGNRLFRMTKGVWDVYRQAIAIKADIYHFHDPELITIGLFLKLQGKKVIYDVHEDVPRQILSKGYLPEYIRPWVAWLIEKIENFATKYFDAVVAATPFICDRFLKLSRRAIYVCNYPILAELHIPNQNWEQKERTVCYVGTIDYIRGIFAMVEAIGQTNAHLLLAGQFTNKLERERAVAMPGWTNVQELGQLNRQEILQTLARSIAGLVVLHPIVNYLDGLPVKMFEYMSAGIPVIASDIPLWKKIIEDNQCGICVDPKNPKAIAEAITWIINHPNEAQNMGKNGRHAVENKYNWEIEKQKLFDIYKQIIDSQ